MKTNVKFLALAVVATAFATSCVKEEIAEENIKDNQDKTEVEITGQVFEAVMENTKSTLVDKTPTWAEEDVIALFGNGSESAVQLTYAGENKFQTASGVTVEGPYYAIYPYDVNHTVDQTTGIFTATVPAEQTIAQGQNVAAGALASVAYSEDTQLYFRNAVSLIRIENKREDIVSIKIESTNAEQMLAGTFTMDLNPDKETEGEDPAVTAVAETGIASITLKPAEGNGMFAPGELYAAVLPTNLDGIKVTFERKGETKNETATVTKTATVELKRNGGANLGAFFSYEIKNAEELLAWNKASAKWTAWDVVTLTDNIDCKDVINSENWTPNEFTGTFDGNNKTIDNFVIEKEGPAAFFLQMTGNAFARNLTFGEGCSFSSKGTYNGARVYAASLVCEIRGNAGMDNITNYAAITGNHAGVEKKGNYIAGICASLSAKKSIVSNCKNYGKVTFSASPIVWTCIGGIFGEVTETATLSFCENHGYLLFNGESNNGSSINIGGIVGGGNLFSMENCKNLGTLESKATVAAGGGTNIGGMIGHHNKEEQKLGTMVNCVNGEKGNTSAGSLMNTGLSSGEIRIGGCIGFVETSASDLMNFTNYGSITNKGVTTKTASMGGVVGIIRNTAGGSITKCTNYGSITHATADMNNLVVHLGGIVGWIDCATTTIGDATLKEIYNYGVVQGKKKSIQFAYGGIVGRINSTTTNVVTIQNCSNELTATVSQTGWLQASNVSGVGGIVGMVHATKSTTGAKTNILSCTNAAEVKKDGQGLQSNFHVGGIVGNITEKASDDASVTVTAHKVIISSCENTGNASMSDNNYGRSSNYCYTGGVVGYFGYSSGEVKECINRGKVSNYFWSKSDGCVRIGGITGNAVNQTYANCKNYGTVSEESKSVQCDAGGIIGRVANGAIKITNCDNFGDLQSKNTAAAHTNGHYISLGGIVGRIANEAFVMDGCDNNCTISNTNTTNTTEIMGGIIGFGAKKGTVKNCSCITTITNSRTTNVIRSGVFGGSWTSGFTISSCSAKGKYGETPITKDNLNTYAFGSGSTFKDVTNITYAE